MKSEKPKGSGKRQSVRPKSISRSPRRTPNKSSEPDKEARARITSLTNTNRQLKRKIFDLYTIFEISRNFNAVLHYETLLETFIFTSLAQVGASRAAIFLERETNSGKFVLALSKGTTGLSGNSQAFSHRSKLCDYVNRLNRPVLTEELVGLATNRELKALKHFGKGLVVPLIYQSELIGLFIIADKMSGNEFQMDDIEFLSILASQISVAIENARLYRAEKKAAERLRSTQEQLVLTERLAALGELSAQVAHEVNNPLGIIKNYILLLKRSISGNVEATNYSEIVGQEIDRIAQIVRELLDFHHPRGLEFKQVDLIKIVENVLQLMERQLSEHEIEIVRDFDITCPPIEASAGNLKQVFVNLILNALDAMPDGGRLNVTLKCIDNQVLISFCDTGEGIPPEIVPRIFEPFFTTKESEKGSGLGLSVCYGIIKRHRGTITYKNLETGGCFEISLPLVHKENASG